MKNTAIGLIFVSMLAVAAGGAEIPKEKLHVYLLIGQSNMAGRAPYAGKEKDPIPGCLLLNDKNTWEPAKNPFNRYSTIRKGLGMQKMNPGYGFAVTMLQAEKGITLGLVVNAKGGTSIKLWKKGDKFFKDAVKRTLIAKKTGVLKGILWHQGESDSKDTAYLEKLKTLIADLREALGEPDLPFVAGQVMNVPNINSQIEKLPSEVKLTGFASSKGLTAMDRWHFDAKSMKMLGVRYAQAILEIRKKQKAPGK